jgi:hypothetical protein
MDLNIIKDLVWPARKVRPEKMTGRIPIFPVGENQKRIPDGSQPARLDWLDVKRTEGNLHQGDSKDGEEYISCRITHKRFPLICSD